MHKNTVDTNEISSYTLASLTIQSNYYIQLLCLPSDGGPIYCPQEVELNHILTIPGSHISKWLPCHVLLEGTVLGYNRHFEPGYSFEFPLLKKSNFVRYLQCQDILYLEFQFWMPITEDTSYVILYDSTFFL